MNPNFSSSAISIFSTAINDYHSGATPAKVNPGARYRHSKVEKLLYDKCWTDLEQWHTEDDIRLPEINPQRALELKRQIDRLNQLRNDIVESIDEYFRQQFDGIVPVNYAEMNTESPAWAIDRLCILCIKAFHMNEQLHRNDVDILHITSCKNKLLVLNEQISDLSKSVNKLLADIQNGFKVMKIYRQMKMYNNPDLNPVLYNAPKAY
jgi:hypothetical protein